MKERPILFSGPMVTAILEGRKTQTRRVCRGQRELSNVHDFRLDECPYGQLGDRLWVRETHGIFSTDTGTVSVGYKARLPEGKTLADTDGGLNVFRPGPEACAWAEQHIDSYGWRPSIFMPRWASRVTLEILKVRVERLQGISEEDAKAEGVGPVIAGVSPSGLTRTYRTGFVGGWNTINAKRGFGWDVDPWVWVIEFSKL